jgi:hypothetical protein
VPLSVATKLGSCPVAFLSQFPFPSAFLFCSHLNPIPIALLLQLKMSLLVSRRLILRQRRCKEAAKIPRYQPIPPLAFCTFFFILLHLFNFSITELSAMGSLAH